MQWLIAEPIPGADVYARSDELPRDFCLVSCRGNMQSRVALPYVSLNLCQKISLLRLAARSHLETGPCERRGGFKKLCNADAITSDDDSDKVPECQIRLHGHRIRYWLKNTVFAD